MTLLESSTETSEQVYKLAKDFALGIKSHFATQTLEGETTLMVDRICAAGAATAAAVLLVIPVKGKDKYVTVLFAAASRLWSRRGL